MKFWCSHRGTISVFLALILLPVVVFGGLVTDAVRVYHAKGLISEAGELAMNAGLSYYDADLKDAYGLLAMKKEPKDMDLEQYFVDTIRASNLPGAGDVRSFLDLKLDGSFAAIGVDGSQIYQTEAEKQQILEYMKYRAPVCIGEELLAKLKQIKDNKKQVEAIKKQTEFAECMDDLQEACQKAKDAIDEYLEWAEEAPEITKENLNAVVAYAEANFEKAVHYLLMLHVCETFSEQDDAENFMDSMNAFNETIGGAQEPSEGNLEAIFAAYVQGIFYYNNLPEGGALSAAVLSAKAGLKKSEADAIDATYATYQELVGRLAVYTANLKATAKARIEDANASIRQTWNKRVDKAMEQTGKCVRSLNKVEDKLKDAQRKHGEWMGKINALSDGEMKNNMKSEADGYADLLSEDALQELKRKFQENEDALVQISIKLQDTKFCGHALTGTIPSDSVKSKVDEMGRTMQISISSSGMMLSKISDTGKRFLSANFEKQEFDETLHKIKDDPFYQKLVELCREKEEEKDKAKEEKDKTNDLLGKLKSALTGDGIDDLGDIDWTEKTLPSVKLEQAADDEADDLDDDTGGANSKSERKKTLEHARSSLDAMSGWLDSIAHILNGAIEYIYITEYGIQMFSYYTVNKQADANGNVTNLTDVKSLSGDAIASHKMPRSEVEYMLWGKKNVQENVKNTKLLLYGIRMVFNMIYAFSDRDINTVSTAMAQLMSCGVQFLVPVFKVVIKVGVAIGETACDVTDLLAGRNVPIIKDKDTRQIDLGSLSAGSSSGSSGRLTFNYKEYVTIFLLVKTVAGEKTTLARIADCIQLNTELDLITAYTMLSVQANVKSRTTFLKKAAALPDSGISAIPDDWYTVSYKSVLGY